MTTIMNVGYIGLGNIGGPSARHLITEPYRPHVYDVVPEAVDALAEAGAVGCGSVAELAGQCAHIGICVRDAGQVASVLYGAGGIFEHAARDTVVAIHATVSREDILGWARDASERDIHLIDAGISGGAQGAEAGTLVYMVGGDAAVVERARPVFMTSAANVVHAGPLGAGMVLKLCNNLITYLQFQAMSEAARLAEQSGIDANLLREVGKTNGVVSEQMHGFISGRNAMAAAASEADLEAMFGPFGKLGEKDLSCALECAGQLGIDLPMTRALQPHVYDMFINRF
ncbi:MAG: NAD(P)-dependent oxidoreductase [Halieaceae bacterium]|nr:NAD(P)-dependent oxidoreductase [Halieaceae bacterium]